jgi:hypothetical protein
MPKDRGYVTRDKLINRRRKSADQIDLTLGGSGRTARPGFGPNGPGAKAKRSNSDRFVTDERSGGDMVPDHPVPNPRHRIPS